MKKTGICILMSFAAITATAQHSHTTLTTPVDSMSYAVGMNIASSLKNGGIDTLNYAVFQEALRDVLDYNHPTMDGTTSNRVVNNYVAAEKAKKSEGFTAAGTAFLEANKNKEGVVVLPSGLQYKVIQAGTGAIPVDGQTVKTHYHGTLIDGKKFDSSYDRGQPASFNVNQVIPGWTEALKLMPVGSTWELYIPYMLAYGDRAMGAKIPPYSTLVFTIELLEIVQ
ncbi:MAG: FKBP-type peptidyl-prolyl cis-trans isomerase [Bacteroidia bacterium]|jgi:FKBP-type peptidyl-prolyl cis-trans isomerase FklB|nr:FKBP-type peptidyl-prolyl cis-trans isomerase [Bacteroidia bacterium]